MRNRSIALVVGTPHGLWCSEEGKWFLHEKTFSGLKQFARALGGNVAIASDQPPNTVSAIEQRHMVCESEFPEEVEILKDLLEPNLLQMWNPEICMLPINFQSAGQIIDSGIPTVLIDDNSPGERKQVSLVDVASPIRRARIHIGAFRTEHRWKRLLKVSKGIQVNGFAAYDYYSHHHSNTHRFFDHRLRRSDIPADDQLKVRNGPLSLMFSGRLISIKGIKYLPLVSRELDQMGIDHTFHILGSGPLESLVRQEMRDRAVFHQFLDFESQWKKTVFEEIDLAVLPHVQGDSSSTYFESIGLGVPVVGFKNDTLEPFVKETGAGIAIDRFDIGAMAEQIANLSMNRNEQLMKMRKSGLAFMRNHSMEDEFDLRARHLKESCR